MVGGKGKIRRGEVGRGTARCRDLIIKSYKCVEVCNSCHDVLLTNLASME